MNTLENALLEQIFGSLPFENRSVAPSPDTTPLLSLSIGAAAVLDFSVASRHV